ncbi:MAG: Unknown protein [uncultured Sulfurovum sp.]|uniref:Cytochrome c domain-containing protein n=1 Tax=uncultured Sulfurovum sp. TaxID=269237 RepID=A0A6S6T8C2_9BACT|nr:MAG: Unknown protein [uncultured Sulfurovum sp.]
MKKIFFCTLIVCMGTGLMASETTSTSDIQRSGLQNIDGKSLYIKRCALCHGKNAQKSPLKGVPALAGRNATILARITLAYREQDNRHGVAYSVNRVSQVMKEATSSLSNQQISAIATYISGL